MTYENLLLELQPLESGCRIHMSFQGTAPLFWKHACQLLLSLVLGAEKERPGTFGLSGEEIKQLDNLSWKVGTSRAKFSVFNVTVPAARSDAMDELMMLFLETLPHIRKIAFVKGGIYAV